MKDIVIKNKSIVKELKIFFLIFIAIFTVNFLSILYFKTKWIELLTTLHITLVFSFVFYAISGIIRTGVKAVKVGIFNLRNKQNRCSDDQ